MIFQFTESADKERILNFLTSIEKNFHPSLKTRVNLNDYSTKLAGNAVNYFLAAGNTDIAHAAFYCNDFTFRVAFISSIGVTPEFQGFGAGEYLLKKIVNTCLEKGMSILRLEVNGDNSKAINIYEKQGFLFISNGLMEKKLTIS